MSKNKKKTQQNKNVLISTKEIEDFKLKLDNFGKELNDITANYLQILDCKNNFFLIF